MLASSKFNRLVRRVLELPLAGIIRFWLWLRIARRDSVATYRIADTSGYLSLNVGTRFFPPGSDEKTVFLLGSGSSINELAEQDFAHIRQGVSIGINAWALHAFVPDVYSFETGQDGDGPSEETKFVSRALNRKQVIELKPKFVFLRPTLPATSRNLVEVPPNLETAAYMYGRANVVTKMRSNLRADLSRIVRAIRIGDAPQNVLLDNGASVVRLMGLFAAQGHKNIVLVGVDLNRSPYFWQSAPSTRIADNVSDKMSRPVGSPHNSLETLDRPFPVDVFISELALVLREEMDVKVWVSSPTSALSKSLPVYPWPSSSLSHKSPTSL